MVIAYSCRSQMNSVTALPASWAFVSYLVVGRTTEIGSLRRGRRDAAAVRHRRPRRCVRRSRGGRSRRAGHHRGVTGRRSGQSCPVAETGACGAGPWARDRGRRRGPRSANRARSGARSTSTPLPRINRMLPTLLAVDRAQQLRQAPLVDLHRDHIDIGLVLGHRQRRCAAAATDFEHQRRLRGQTRRGCPAARAAGAFPGRGAHGQAELRPQPLPGLPLGVGKGGTPGAKARCRKMALVATAVRRPPPARRDTLPPRVAHAFVHGGP